MGLTLITGPASEPITATQAKAHMRVDLTDDDTVIAAYITAARTHLEGLTRRAFVEQTWDYTLPFFPAGAIEIPIQPVTSVTSVSFIDSDGATATYTYGTSPDTPKYDVLTDGPKTRIIPKYNETWPTNTRIHGNGVTVRFVAGYATVPADIVQAIYLLTAHFYENRETVSIAPGVVAQEIPMTVEALISPYILRGF
jgi:uncharacterized phiE125 gp8 family phage protein